MWARQEVESEIDGDQKQESSSVKWLLWKGRKHPLSGKVI